MIFIGAWRQPLTLTFDTATTDAWVRPIPEHGDHGAGASLL
jgi:hypothetical protein